MAAEKKRVLPPWMTKKEDSKENCSKVSTSMKNILDEEMPYLEFHGKIHYIYTKDECNFYCQSIIESLTVPITCGFDIEWKVNYQAGEGPRKTAVFQLCMSEDECFVFHVSAMTGFPIALKSLIEDCRIIKAGVGVHGDMSKISLEFNLKPAGIADLSQMLNEVKNISENWSLNGMVLHMLKKRIAKDPRIRCSNWERYPLTDEQLKYAALDAYASWILYSKIVMLKDSSLEESAVNTN